MFLYILHILSLQTLLSVVYLSASGVCLWTRFTTLAVKRVSFGIRDPGFKSHTLLYKMPLKFRDIVWEEANNTETAIEQALNTCGTLLLCSG